MAMLKSLFPTRLPWSSPNEAKFIPKQLQLSLPDKPLPAKSIPLLIPNNTTYSPEESTLHCRKGKILIHLSIVQISCLPCTSMAIVLCKACPALAVTLTSYLALIGQGTWHMYTMAVPLIFRANYSMNNTCKTLLSG